MSEKPLHVVKRKTGSKKKKKMAADGLKRLESGRYRDDESGSIASLGMTRHTRAQSCDQSSADTLFSGSGRWGKAWGLTVHAEFMHCLSQRTGR